MLIYGQERLPLKEGKMAKQPKIENIRLTTKDIGAYCQVSKSTVILWIESDRLKAFRLPGGHYRIDRGDFREFLKKWNMPVRGWPFEAE
jgi:excisionase family DNA binding protein